MKTVSVIVTTYNRQNILPNALKSLEAQSYKDFDVIVVDDHSDTKVKINKKDYSFPIKLIRLEENSGFHTRPKNVGIVNSEGEYISYLDDDDEYTENHLQLQMDAMNTPNEYDFVYGRRVYVNKDGVTESESSFREWKPDQAHLAFWLGTPDILHKRYVIYELGGWNEGIRRFGDFELACRLGRWRGAEGQSFKAKALDVAITRCFSYDEQISSRPYFSEQTLIDNPIKQSWLENLTKTK